MSERVEHPEPKPSTRREAAESLSGHETTAIQATGREPARETETTTYHHVQVRPDRLEPKHNAFIVSAATMVFVSLITFYLPLFNSLLGGVFGGFFAHGWKRAMGAAFVASAIVPATLALLYGFDSPDIIYLFYGLSFWGFTALHVAGLFIGAAAGVLSRPLASRRRTVSG